MPRLDIARAVLDDYAALAKEDKSRLRKTIEMFQQLTIDQLHSPRGVHLEKVQGAKDDRIRTVRITRSWRGVVLAPDDGTDVFVLLRVMAHDAAYDWAVPWKFSVNAVTNTLEVRNEAVIEQLVPSMREAAEQAPKLLFERHSDTILRDLGIDDQVLEAVRTIIDKAQLESFAKFLPEEQAEVLQFLAEGFTSQEVYRDIIAERRQAPDASGSLAVAIANTPSRIALVTGPQELADILDKPFSVWRIYLHSSQRRVAYRPSYNGSAQVTGGPGTGKTVVALHRVKHLLYTRPGSRIMLTTYTNVLAGSLRESLGLLIDDPEKLARVEVTTVNSFAYRTVQRLAGRVPSIINDADERHLWRRIRERLGLQWTEQFLEQEFRHVVLAQRVTSLDEYLKVERRGRGTRLSAQQRERLWEAMEAFRSDLRMTGSTTHLQLCDRATLQLGGADLATYGFDHLVVDEAQDLHPAQWRLLRAAVPEGPDDLFITGDPHQRIYDSKVTLSSLGIAVAGRSGKLRVNYRSTAQILDWATKVIDGVPVEDVGGPGPDSLAGYISVLSGRLPHATGFQHEQDEATAVVEKVKEWIGQGIRPAEIAVTARFNILLDRIGERLAAAHIPAVRMKDQPGAAVEGVRLATMHAMKGLEFRCVAVAGVTARALPFDKEVTPQEVDRLQHESDMLRQRCLLFVACTRARESLHVSWNGTPSPFLPRVIEMRLRTVRISSPS
ncbi:UvrD-helicase domain-containing protein [Nonomuraea longicatena]|uniref:DNA 3'-5' helicase n=1 Tax=Nonomuraea longicatena TaxID=83682 RepID=A0ABP4BGY9_9ACTN